jgi:hypothetical protein
MLRSDWAETAEGHPGEHANRNGGITSAKCVVTTPPLWPRRTANGGNGLPVAADILVHKFLQIPCDYKKKLESF